MSFPLLIAGLQLTASSADQPPWWIGANQRDDQGALGFGDASLAADARAIAKPIESLGVEAMDALADRLWVAPQSSEAICVVRSSPSQLRAIIRALFIQSPGAWRLSASLRTFRSSSASSGARARSSFGTVFSFPGRRSCYALVYSAFEERSNRSIKYKFYSLTRTFIQHHNM